MIINQSKIINTNKLSSYKGSKIRVTLQVRDENLSLIKNVGFKDLIAGERILPAKKGRISIMNAEGFNIVHKDQPMITKYREMEIRRAQWTGGGDWEMVDDIVDVPYKCYPRTRHAPYNIELTILEKDGIKFVVSDEIVFTEENDKLLKVAVNLFLELFHECSVVKDDFSDLESHTKIIRLCWEILPKGEYPFEDRLKQLQPILNRLRPRDRHVIENRLEILHSYKPDSIAIGINGFSGYIIFSYNKKKLYVFESTQPDNATYVFDGDWERISTMTKKEVLEESLQKARIIHLHKTWYKEIHNLLK